jgi:AcrR family transcriptional regulator
LDAALDLIAERGEDGVTLREVTDAAEANVAAVSYHFGSLKALCDTAIEDALERYLGAQQEDLTALGPEATLEDFSAAMARQMIHLLSAGGRDLAVLRIVARTGFNPPQGWDRLDARFAELRANGLRVLRRTVPGVKDHELVLRAHCVVGMLNYLAIAPVSAELVNRSEKQLARWLVPIIAGAFRGTHSEFHPGQLGARRDRAGAAKSQRSRRL